MKSKIAWAVGAGVAAATAMSAAEKLDIAKIDRNMAAKTVSYKDIQWFDPAEAPFRLSGLNWFKQNKRYRRLPKIPADLHHLLHRSDRMGLLPSGHASRGVELSGQHVRLERRSRHTRIGDHGKNDPG